MVSYQFIPREVGTLLVNCQVYPDMQCFIKVVKTMSNPANTPKAKTNGMLKAEKYTKAQEVFQLKGTTGIWRLRPQQLLSFHSYVLENGMPSYA